MVLPRRSGRAHARRWSALVGLLAAGVGCREPEPPAPRIDVESASVVVERVEVGGCVERNDAGDCLVGQRAQLVLWSDLSPEFPLVALVDDEPVRAVRREVQGGQQLELTIDGPDHVIKLRAGEALPTWALVLKPADTIDTRVLALSKAAMERDVVAELEALLPELDGPSRRRALGNLRSLAMMRGRPADAIQWAEQEHALAWQLGRRRAAVEAAHAAASMSIQSTVDLDAARRWLERGARASADSEQDLAEQRRYEGMLAERSGDPRAAVRAYEEAERRAERLGQSQERGYALDNLGLLHASLGRMDLAAQIMASALELVPTDAPGCGRAIVEGNYAWYLLLAHEAGLELGDPLVPLDEALARAATDTACPPGFVGNLRINAAFGAIQRADPARARAELDALALLQEQGLGRDGNLEAWRLELEHQLALLGGEPSTEMLAAIDEQTHVQATRDGVLHWLAATTRGRALAAAGELDRARAAFEQAEGLLDDRALALGVLEGTDLLLQIQLRSAKHLVGLLVRRGDPAAAYCAARRARSRATWRLDREARLSALAQRKDGLTRWSEAVDDYQRRRLALEQEQADDWRFVGPARTRRQAQRRDDEHALRDSLDAAYRLLGTSPATTEGDRCAALPPAVPGELTLAAFPVDEGWVTFAANATTVRAHPHAEPDWADEAAVARAMLEPFAAELDAAQRVRVLPVGPVWSVAVHALPWRDDVLVAHRPVIYGLDLQAVSEPRSPGRVALVLADPTGSLAGARTEAKTVSDRLTEGGWQLRDVTTSRGSDLSHALDGVDLFHYAGHGQSTGVGGWGSALLLADETSVGVADILALPRVPSVAVLAGCETGSADIRTLAGGMSLARAFILAGSELVIASTQQVDDGTTARLVESIYQPPPNAPVFDGAERLRRAQLQMRNDAAQPNTWRDLRAFVR